MKSPNRGNRGQVARNREVSKYTVTSMVGS